MMSDIWVIFNKIGTFLDISPLLNYSRTWICCLGTDNSQVSKNTICLTGTFLNKACRVKTIQKQLI